MNRSEIGRIALFLLILSLVPLYIVTVTLLPLNVEAACGDGESGTTEKLGFCEEISFDVQRSYYMGLLRLPVYRAGIKLDLFNKLFLPVLVGLAAAVYLY